MKWFHVKEFMPPVTSPLVLVKFCIGDDVINKNNYFLGYYSYEKSSWCTQEDAEWIGNTRPSWEVIHWALIE